jgi:ribonuclease VapC
VGTIVIDASAVVAILTGEQEAPDLLESIALAPQRCMSAANLLEARLVLEIGRGLESERISELLARWQVEIVAFEPGDVDLAFDTYRRFGKGRHAARLNMGDCAAYALAKARGWPLLYKGDDFALTDIERA